MDEEILYPVCPHRNVPAAFARFNGPDSGGIARFFDDEHLRFLDGLSSVAPSIWFSARLCGSRLARAWNHWTTHPQLPLLLGPQPMTALRIGFAVRQALPGAAGFVSRLRQSCRARLVRAWSHWLSHPQLPLLPGPQLLRALPV